MAAYLKGLDPDAVLALGPVPTRGDDVTFTPDQRKGRTGDTSFVVPRPFTIHAEKCPNVNGVVSILEHFQGELIDYETIVGRIAAGEFRGLYVAANAIDPAYSDGGRPATPAERRVSGRAGRSRDRAGPGGRRRAGRGDVRREGGLLRQLSGTAPVRGRRPAPARGHPAGPRPLRDPAEPRAGPIPSREVLEELAGTVPAFAAARGGTLPTFGQPLSEPAMANGDAFVYRDPWLTARGDKGDRPGEPTPKGSRNA